MGIQLLSLERVTKADLYLETHLDLMQMDHIGVISMTEYWQQMEVVTIGRLIEMAT